MRSAIVASVQPDETPSFGEIVRILQRLRRELTQHFAEEEGGGCLDEAVSRCPSLSVEYQSIQAEHPQILAQIDALIEQARTSPPTPQNQVAIQGHFARLYKRVQAHEAAENRLLAAGFGRPVTDEESASPQRHPDF
jgi:hypothetical protein